MARNTGSSSGHHNLHAANPQSGSISKANQDLLDAHREKLKAGFSKYAHALVDADLNKTKVTPITPTARALYNMVPDISQSLAKYERQYAHVLPDTQPSVQPARQPAYYTQVQQPSHPVPQPTNPVPQVQQPSHPALQFQKPTYPVSQVQQSTYTAQVKQDDRNVAAAFNPANQVPFLRNTHRDNMGKANQDNTAVEKNKSLNASPPAMAPTEPRPPQQPIPGAAAIDLYQWLITRPSELDDKNPGEK